MMSNTDSATETITENLQAITIVDEALAYSEYETAKPVMDKEDNVAEYLYYHHIPIMNHGLKLREIFVEGNDTPEDLLFAKQIDEYDHWQSFHQYTMVVNTPKRLRLIYR